TSFSNSFFYYPIQQPHIDTLFPYTTLFRSQARVHQQVVDQRGHAPRRAADHVEVVAAAVVQRIAHVAGQLVGEAGHVPQRRVARSEEHTSELQSRENLVCRLLLEKKKDKDN